MTYPCLPGGGVIGNNRKNHWDQYLSQKNPKSVENQVSLISLRAFYFAVWKIKDVGFVLKTKYISESENFCV